MDAEGAAVGGWMPQRWLNDCEGGVKDELDSIFSVRFIIISVGRQHYGHLTSANVGRPSGRWMPPNVIPFFLSDSLAARVKVSVVVRLRVNRWAGPHVWIVFRLWCIQSLSSVSYRRFLSWGGETTRYDPVGL